MIENDKISSNLNSGQKFSDNPIPNEPSPQITSQRRDFSFINVLVIAVACIFSIGASIWLLIPPSKRTLPHSFVPNQMFPGANTSTTSPVPTPSPLPPAVIADLAFLSQELSSGDLSRIAAVSEINPQKISLQKSTFSEIKSVTFDPQSFRLGTNPNHATAIASVVDITGKTTTSVFLLTLKNGHWRIGQ